jgi:hypothetical protein
LHAHVADEAEALADDRADQFLLLPAVADSPSRGIDPTRERRARDAPATPNRPYEIVPADNAVTVLHEVGQEIEYLRLDRDRGRATAQLAPIDIKYMVSKEKLHFGVPQRARLKDLSRSSQTQINRWSRPCDRDPAISAWLGARLHTQEGIEPMRSAPRGLAGAELLPRAPTIISRRDHERD